MARGAGCKVRTSCCFQSEGKSESRMKTAFTLILIALLIIPAAVTMRIMVWRERQRQRRRGDES